MRDSEIVAIWKEFKNGLLNFIRVKVNNEYEAEDILQEVFIKIYRNIEQLDDDAKIKSWLYKITNNTIIDYYRKGRTSLLPIDGVEIGQESAEENANMNDEMTACLKLFLYKLPDKYKEPLEMFEFKGMKHREISKSLNISLSGSKTRIQRARQKLKGFLTKCCEIEFDTFGNIVEYNQKEYYQCPNKNCK